jgi:hypothetical protein
LLIRSKAGFETLAKACKRPLLQGDLPLVGSIPRVTSREIGAGYPFLFQHRINKKEISVASPIHSRLGNQNHEEDFQAGATCELRPKRRGDAVQ